MDSTDADSADLDHKVILVVDDDEGVGTFLVEALKLEDSYRVLLTSNASEALSLVQSLRPDVCVLDYQLPGITGLELAERLHQMEPFEQLPIVLMSANAPKHVQEREDLTFLAKPFNLDELLQVIAVLLEG